jgi:urea transport system substrate-binding protein
MKRRNFIKGMGVGALTAAGIIVAPSIIAAPSIINRSNLDNDIVVGFLFSLTGSVAVVEHTLHNAALLAVEEINASGGINGRMIKPIIEDPASDPATYADRARRLIIRDKCVSVFGGYTSASRQAVLPVAEQQNNLFWYPTLFEGRECSRNIIYGGAVPNQQQDNFIPWLVKKHGKNFYMIGNNYVYPKEENNYCKTLLKNLDGKVVNEEYVPLGHSDFSSVINRIRAEKPDVIFSTLVGDSDVAFARQYAAAGFDPADMPVASLTRSEIEVKAIGGEAAAGHYSSAPYFMGYESPENEHFIQAYKKRFGENDVTHFVSEAAYYQVYQFKAAMEKLGNAEVTPTAIRDAAVGLTLQAPQGEVYIDENLHTHVWPKVAQWQKDGTAKIILSSESRIAPKPYAAYPNSSCTGEGLIKTT